MTEQEQAEFDRLKKRLANTEQAILELCGLIGETLPPESRYSLALLIEKFTVSNFHNGAPFSGEITCD